jgi:hypothetical protein
LRSNDPGVNIASPTGAQGGRGRQSILRLNFPTRQGKGFKLDIRRIFQPNREHLRICKPLNIEL